MSNSSHNFIHYALGLLLAFAALNAFGGGYYGMSGAKEVQTEWLQGSPFRNYFLTGLILFVIVDGSFFFGIDRRVCSPPFRPTGSPFFSGNCFRLVDDAAGYHRLRVLDAADNSGCRVGNYNPRLVATKGN